MKDALGHGSDAHGSGVQQVGKQSVELMSKSQIEQLRTQFAGIKSVDPSQPTYGKLTAFLSDTHPARLKQLADANIPFLSSLARNRLPKNEYNSSGNKWGSPAALADFKREHGGPANKGQLARIARFHKAVGR